MITKTAYAFLVLMLKIIKLILPHRKDHCSPKWFKVKTKLHLQGVSAHQGVQRRFVDPHCTAVCTHLKQGIDA